jgi:hypothetical protein
MTDISYIELSTINNSPLTNITSNDYTELLLTSNTTLSNTTDWNNELDYPRLTYTGIDTRTFICIATLSIDSNKSGKNFSITFGINNNPSNKDIISNISISGKSEEITLTAIFDLSTNDTISIFSKAVDINTSFRIAIVRLNFTIHSLQGTQGMKGNDGIAGSGSSIIIKNMGTNITNTPHTSLNFIGEGFQVIDDNGSATISLNSNLYGTQYHYIEEDSISKTTAEWISKLTLTTDDLPLGVYRLNWYSEISNGDNSKSMTVRCQHNGNTITGPIFNTFSYYAFGNNVWSIFNGFKQISNLSGINTFTIDYGLNNSNGDGIAQIRNSRLELYRIN